MKVVNKAELTKKFGIRFCTLTELVRLIEKRNVSALLTNYANGWRASNEK